jgi:hypothetical protein
LPVNIGAALQRLDIIHGVKKKRFVVRFHGAPPATSEGVLYLRPASVSISAERPEKIITRRYVLKKLIDNREAALK